MKHLMIVFTIAAVFCHQAIAAGERCGSLLLGDSNEVKAADSIESSLVKVRDSMRQLRLDLKSNPGKDDKALQAALKNLPEDPRELSYLLQGAYRLIIANPNSKAVLGHRTSRQMYQGLEWVKSLEKILGTFQNSRDLVKAAEKIGAPADFIKHLKKQREATAAKTIALLKKEDFIGKGKTVLDEMLERVERLRKIDEQAGQGYIVQALKSEIHRVHEKVDSEMRPLMNKNNYTFHELEFGAHAFRRSLRWLKVYILAYKNYFRADLPNRSLTATEMALLERNQGKDNLVLNPEGSRSIDQVEFLLLNDLITELRKIKGIGELRQNLIEQLQDFRQWDGVKISKSEAEKIISDLMKDNFEGIEQRTQALLKIYDSVEGFENLVRENP